MWNLLDVHLATVEKSSWGSNSAQVLGLHPRQHQ